MTMTETGLIPEEKCAHAELRDCWSLSWATCRDCGSMVNCQTIGAVSHAEMQAAVDKMEEKAYDDGVTDGKAEEAADMESSIVAQLRDWAKVIGRALNNLPEGQHDDVFATIEGVREEMKAWRA